MEKIHENYELNAKRASFAFIGVEFFEYGLYFLTIGICYRYRPVATFFARPSPKLFIENLRKKWPTIYGKTESYIIRKADKFAEWRFFKPIPSRLGLDSNRFVKSILEAEVIGNLILPITMIADCLIIKKCFQK